MGALELIRRGWGFRLPGERSLYWVPGRRLPQGVMEVFTISSGKLTWYVFLGVSEDILAEAQRIRAASQAILEDLRMPGED